eukprot:TRINITY_DN1720_c0_g1_i6.p1 TRINITY_DN1720_c0_g1~~TRINITY_DN1720_c0_g1_i6.p1  ORF type:complete len:361 (+),score=16.73 TRINITY_DN1720_c0_g1_i6:32-1114(+)
MNQRIKEQTSQDNMLSIDYMDQAFARDFFSSMNTSSKAIHHEIKARRLEKSVGELKLPPLNSIKRNLPKGVGMHRAISSDRPSRDDKRAGNYKPNEKQGNELTNAGQIPLHDSGKHSGQTRLKAQVDIDYDTSRRDRKEVDKEDNHRIISNIKSPMDKLAQLSPKKQPDTTSSNKLQENNKNSSAIGSRLMLPKLTRLLNGTSGNSIAITANQSGSPENNPQSRYSFFSRFRKNDQFDPHHVISFVNHFLGYYTLQLRSYENVSVTVSASKPTDSINSPKGVIIRCQSYQNLNALNEDMQDVYMMMKLSSEERSFVRYVDVKFSSDEGGNFYLYTICEQMRDTLESDIKKRKKKAETLYY